MFRLLGRIRFGFEQHLKRVAVPIACRPVSGSLTNVAGLVDRHRWVIEAFVFTLIIGLGVAARIWLVDQPNFKPVAALILFAGFFFQRGSLALVAMLLIMLVSNQQLGNYEWPLALSVYAGLAVSALLGMQIKRRVGHQAGEQLQPKSIAMFAGASIVMSTCFYLLTNGMVWCVGAWYPQTWEGFVQCYAAGIPFYRVNDEILLHYKGFSVTDCVFHDLNQRFEPLKQFT